MFYIIGLTFDMKFICIYNPQERRVIMDNHEFESIYIFHEDNSNIIYFDLQTEKGTVTGTINTSDSTVNAEINKLGNEFVNLLYRRGCIMDIPN